MNKKLPVSVVISAYNEEKKIVDCLESVQWADEIIFVDNESTDDTAKIAKKYTSHIYVKENNLMLNSNKNFGFTKAKHQWILSLDADERVTPELAEEISQVIENNDENINGYWIPRKNIIFGKWIQHTGWYPDHVLRLFRNGKGKFAEKHVHEMIQLTGEAGYLTGAFIHLNYETISQFIYKTTTIYAPNEASELIRKGYAFEYMDAIRFPLKEFLSRFFAREGYKDGFHGLMLSLLMAFYHLIVFANMWEAKKFEDKQDNIVEAVYQEANRAKKELKYWFYTEKVNNAKNTLSKSLFKLRRKI